MLYRYETHLHTYPVSKCGKATVRENLEFYKKMGYAGVFITNHFLDGNINIDSDLPYRDRLEFFCSDYEEGVRIGEEIGLQVFFGAELTYKGTDFLVYGLDKQWFLEHPEIESMKKTEELPFLMENGALVVQAHPYREAKYIDHIRLFPRSVQGVETVNACRTDFENEMAMAYAKAYGLVALAGSDNHSGAKALRLAGMESDTPLCNEQDFAERIKNQTMRIFVQNLS